MGRAFEHLAVVVLATGTLFVGPARAATIAVHRGGDLQAAIDGASDGDTIVVGRGKYGPISLTDRTDLVIKGRGGAVVGGGVGDNCVALTNCSRITVAGLTLKDSRLSAVRGVGCDTVAVRRCRMLNAGDDGVVFESSVRITIDRNVIDTTAGNGISASDDSTKPTHLSTITRNRIARATGGGIEVRGDDDVVERNRVRRSNDHGVLVGSGTRDVVARNRLERITFDAIALLGDGNTVASNVVLRPTGQGISVGADANVITRNVVSRAGTAGI
jgi:hypothetical protein